MENRRIRQSFSIWLVEVGACTRSIPHLLDAYCRFLNEEGFGILRCNLVTDTIHPQMAAMRHVWFRDAIDVAPIRSDVLVSRQQYLIDGAMIDEVFFNADGHESPQFKVSPFYVVEQEGEVYEQVKPAGRAQPFPVFDELAANGCTAYFGKLLHSFAGMKQMIGLATASPGGLELEEIDDLRWSLEMLTLHLNTLIECSIKDTLAEVYLGRDPGRRVSQGMISAGNVIALEGAIWFSDIRGFTEQSERLEPEALVEMLNAYFATVVGPIYENGGEILKYIGDAILAVFPSSSFSSPSKACQAAIETAIAAKTSLDALNRERKGTGADPIEHGIGLHFGNAQYGNIGGGERLDFTLIGREVNVASRIEGLTKELKTKLLCSQPFAEVSGIEMELLGQFNLKGIEDRMTVHRPHGF